MNRMNKMLTRDAKSFFLDKTRIQHIVALQNAKMGFIPDPAPTPRKAQEAVEWSLRDNRLAPEDNIFSRVFITARKE